MGADERKAGLRKVAEAILMYRETEPPENELVMKFILDQLEKVRNDALTSAQALEDAGNLTQAIDLRNAWKWLEEFAKQTDVAEGIKLLSILETTYKDKLPEFKRRMLKKEDVIGKMTIGLDLATVGGEVTEVSIVKDPPNPAAVITKITPLKPIRIKLAKNVSVKVHCKNPIQRAINKYIDIKVLVMRGTEAEILERDVEKGMTKVNLLMDNDLWPDAERDNNHVWVPTKDLRQPMKEMPNGNGSHRVQNPPSESVRQDSEPGPGSGNRVGAEPEHDAQERETGNSDADVARALSNILPDDSKRFEGITAVEPAPDEKV
jgi:hypothetical protein